jgi:hypothetical protein
MPDQSATETATLAASRVVGPLPLMDAENPKSYQELLDQMSSMLGPQNILEEIWIREIAELTWDAFRLRRMKANGLSGAAHRAVQAAFEPLFGNEAKDTACGWLAGNQATVEAVEAAFSSAGGSMEETVARNVSPSQWEIEKADRIDRMIGRLEARRKAMLEQFERHREKPAIKLRRPPEREDSA